jgi:hypothetical protein
LVIKLSEVVDNLAIGLADELSVEQITPLIAINMTKANDLHISIFYPGPVW